MGDIPHCLGYWGYGVRNQLNQQLNHGVAKFVAGYNVALELPDQPHHQALIWSVVEVLNSGKLKSVDGFSLSAGGFAHVADAWVRIQSDNSQQSLILGREAFGRVPLYWLQQGEVIWFASQLRLLLPILTNPEINLAGLYGYTCFSYVPNPITPVNHIFTIPAGNELIWQSPQNTPHTSHLLPPPKLQIIHQWQQDKIEIQDEQTAIQELQTHLKNAVQTQISDLSDEPVGVFLSGGLDSAIVASLLVQAGVKVRAYTLDFTPFGVSEFPYAEKVADFLHIPCQKVAATPNLIKQAIIPTVKALDLPFGDGVTVPLYLLNQTASQETQIIFNGEGGDQLFAGWTNKPLIAASVYGENDFTQNYLRTFHRLWGYETQIFTPEISTQIHQLSPEIWLQTALDPAYCSGLLHRLRRASLMLKGAQNIHPRATNLGFAHGLRVRSLFCDFTLANWTFKLAGELCLQGSCEKYILKRAVENWLPPEIVWRQKRGMGVPLTSWCLKDFWYQIGTWLNPNTLKAGKYLQSDIAAKIATGKFSANIQGRRIGEILWLLIMWELWKIHVFGEKPAPKSWNHPFWLPSFLSGKLGKWEKLSSPRFPTPNP